MKSVTSKKLKILGIGEVTQDISCVLEDFPKENQKHDSLQTLRSVGGPVAAGLIFLAKIGHRCELVTKIGSDRDGEWMSKQLKSSNLDIISNPCSQTKTNWYLVNSKTGTRTGIKTTCTPSAPVTISTDKIQEAKIILMDRHELDCIDQIIKHKHKNAVLMIDPSADTRLEVIKALRAATLPVVPIEFLQKMYAGLDLEASCNQFLTLINKKFVVTLGKYGSLLVEESKTTHIRPIRVSCKDALGAGDVFRAALALELARSKPILQALSYASATAGLQCTKLGNTTSIPDSKTLKNWQKIPTTNYSLLQINQWYKGINL